MNHNAFSRIVGARTGRRKRGLVAAAAVLAAGALAASLASPAQGVRAGEMDPRGFPANYTDPTGLTLVICEDGTARCGNATPPDLDSPDGENFYWMATATVPTARGPIDVEFALEAAWATATKQIVFDRFRVRGHVSRAGKYTLLHPFGSNTVTATSPANARNLNFTSDRGCGVLAANKACKRRITNFLHPSNPGTVGYIGNPNRATQVTGSTLRNKIVVMSGGRVIGQTSKFAIQGKVTGAAALLPSSRLDMGRARTAKTKSVVIRNPGDLALDISSITVTGAPSINRVSTSTCRSGATVASGGSCTLTMRYRPNIAKLRVSKATVTINDNSPAGVHRMFVKARK